MAGGKLARKFELPTAVFVSTTVLAAGELAACPPSLAYNSDKYSKIDLLSGVEHSAMSSGSSRGGMPKYCSARLNASSQFSRIFAGFRL